MGSSDKRSIFNIFVYVLVGMRRRAIRGASFVFEGAPHLETERLVLHEMVPEDAEGIFHRQRD